MKFTMWQTSAENGCSASTGPLWPGGRLYGMKRTQGSDDRIGLPSYYFPLKGFFEHDLRMDLLLGGKSEVVVSDEESVDVCVDASDEDSAVVASDDD